MKRNIKLEKIGGSDGIRIGKACYHRIILADDKKSRRNNVFREIEKLKFVKYSLLGKISKLIQKEKF
ncbi:hypothetical protein CN908_23225 [Bacillus thuringiensis]|nr:hypothetical protein CN908_23225 [Bacillus thuringiensis]